MNKLWAVWLLSIAQFSCGPYAGMTSREQAHAVFEVMQNNKIGTSLVNSVLNNPYTERVAINGRKAVYVSRRKSSPCITEFTIDADVRPFAKGYVHPSESAKRYYVQHGLPNGQPAWEGELSGAIVSWRYLSDPKSCIADFTGK